MMPGMMSALLLLALAQDVAERRLLYVASPGIRNYVEWGGKGVLVYDIDDGHRLLRRIPSPFDDPRGQVHLRQEPSAENIAIAVGVGGHGEGADCGFDGGGCIGHAASLRQAERACRWRASARQGAKGRLGAASPASRQLPACRRVVASPCGLIRFEPTFYSPAP